MKELLSYKEQEKIVDRLREMVAELQQALTVERGYGRALPAHRKGLLRKMRKSYPRQTAEYLDTEIACAYSAFCEQQHGVSWGDTDIEVFAVWAFSGAIVLYREDNP